MEIYSGALALLSTFLVAVLGIGSQIWFTHKTKKVDSISPLLVILLAFNCGAFVFHSLVIKDLTFLLCQIPWIIFGGIFFYQFIKYRSKNIKIDRQQSQNIYTKNLEIKLYFPETIHLKKSPSKKGGENA
ncbi:MAG: hypothetical protein CO137_03045 [Candidatus Magasanikbacteria bacterium CG_4_9_14_3_um_filter_32_9]|uniref:Uncharacterized protein n=1 Tax=Candidatus Magasanikbacteria bacterium CG_4_9_14_3_um_filter_32_9 TaxID=1974644 RepID=A0A2M7Z6B7_9BACT|nr:MAG: hypothetical protein CO137_03045 [Candidatus Magasanikbacteria bacterium CG_4_9_14_3_um_filter_32_9]